MIKIIFSFFLIGTSVQSISAQQHIAMEELEPLKFLVDEWNVKVDARLSKNGPWEKSEARSVIKKVIGGTIFEEEYTGTKQGRVITGKGWVGNDNRTKLYQRVYTDSDHGVLIVFEGKLVNQILTLENVQRLENVQLILRVQYSLLSTDFFKVESFRSIDNGTTWDRTGSSEYTRAK